MASPKLVSWHLFLLMLNCFLVAASLRTMKRSAAAAKDSRFLRSSPESLPDDRDRDVVSQHMFRLYEKYSRENRPREGNTVRSFRANQGSSDHRTEYRLNLTSLQDSEVILSAAFHFLLDQRPHQKPWFCKRFKSPPCRSSAIHPPPSVSLVLRSVSSGSEVRSGSMGSFLGNVTFHPHRRGVWQMKDVTQVIKEAQKKGHLLVSVEVDIGHLNQRKAEQVVSTGNLPYLLLYANDQALMEPNSVAASLQRYDPFNKGGELPSSSQSSQLLRRANSSPELKGRVRRETNALSDRIQNNELPEVDYRPDGYRKDDLWESTWYLALKPKLKEGKKDKKRKSQENKETMNSQAHVLSFDEQTMRRARRRQWVHNQHRGCSRRNLRVDFADIGWSEWVIEPKAFDAYYCAGTCRFPMSKVARPSNHATIQSIVRAVGIIPGIPEPCCVPDKMNSLAVLYQDESKNPVLKVYPNMSVQSCSCR
ncbi:growth/differentiation factor 10 [Brachionichthys hirsutus]|uniref:growth/differentiation factor 10 n=1 Tax=Brachionichthys hirsutus TaxID=412623 RepID=UPI003605060A